MLERAISIIEDADAIPKFRLLKERQLSDLVSRSSVARTTNLGISEVIERLLISRVRLLEVIHHEVAVSYQRRVSSACGCRRRLPTQTAPDVPVIRIELQDAVQVVHRFVKLLLRPQDRTDGVHRGNGPRVRAQSVFVRLDRIFQTSNHLEKASYKRTVST